jgi:hypothetical protein
MGAGQPQNGGIMKRILAALAASALCTGVVAAADPPMPRLFQGMPKDKGQWRMEILELVVDGKRETRTPQAMTLCTENLLRQSREQGNSRREEDPSCTYRLLKDTAAEAQMEMVCKDATSRVNMKREGPKTVLMESETSGKRGTTTGKMRYTYEGACQEGQGPIGFGRDSDECKQMRAQAGAMDPATVCAQAGAGRAACEQQMRQSMAQMQGMCK